MLYSHCITTYITGGIIGGWDSVRLLAVDVLEIP